MKLAMIFLTVISVAAQNQFGQQLQYQNGVVQQDEHQIRSQMQQVDQDEASIQKELSQINHADTAQSSTPSWQQQQQQQQQYGSQQAAYGGANQYPNNQYQQDTNAQQQYNPNSAYPNGAMANPAAAGVQGGIPTPLLLMGLVGAAAVCYINGGWRAHKILDYSSEDRFNPRL